MYEKIYKNVDHTMIEKERKCIEKIQKHFKCKMD